MIEQQNLRDVIAGQARRFGKQAFLECGGRSYSFADVDDRTDRAATALTRVGLRAGDRVAVVLSNRPELLFFLWGAPKIGAVTVPLDPSDAVDDIAAALAASAVSAVVTETRLAELREKVPHTENWIFVDDTGFENAPFWGLEQGPILGFWPDLRADDPAVIIRTKPAHGDARLVVLTHRNLLSSGAQTLQPFRIDETDRFVCLIPLTSIPAQVLLLLTPWMAGARTILDEAFPPDALKRVQSGRATVVAGPPRLYEALAARTASGSDDLGSLRLALSYSGPVREKILLDFERRYDALVVEGYALPEATGLACANPYTGVRKPGSIGQPLPGQALRIVDPNGSDVGVEAAGEIIVRGPNVMREYYGDSGATRRVLRDGWLHTGDLGYFDCDGYYYLSGAEVNGTHHS